MSNRLLLLMIGVLITGCGETAFAQSPFRSGTPPKQMEAKAGTGVSFFTRLALYQQQLRQQIAGLIRDFKTTGNATPLLAVMVIALGYGILHAAGPGHGKAVAMSFVLSRHPSVVSGLAFAAMIALFHGFSGVISVLILYYAIQKSITGSLASITSITQLISFGLIVLLGVVILIIHGRRLFFISTARQSTTGASTPVKNRHGLLPLAVAVGLVPCPGVMMVMLFCISMEVPALGILLSACIALGMALTISVVVVVMVMGKASVLKTVSETRRPLIEAVTGTFSGLAVTIFGALFFVSVLTSALF